MKDLVNGCGFCGRKYVHDTITCSEGYSKEQQEIDDLNEKYRECFAEREELKSQLEREQKCVELAVEVLEWYDYAYREKQLDASKEDNTAYEALTKIKSLRGEK